MAEATEGMVHNITQLMAERDKYKRWYENECVENQRLRRSANALRGVINHMKKSK